MKNLRYFTIVISLMFLLSSCHIWNSVFKKEPKSGCPSNGKNIGAERLMGGDPKAEKEAKRAKKFRS